MAAAEDGSSGSKRGLPQARACKAVGPRLRQDGNQVCAPGKPNCEPSPPATQAGQQRPLEALGVTTNLHVSGVRHAPHIGPQSGQGGHRDPFLLVSQARRRSARRGRGHAATWRGQSCWRSRASGARGPRRLQPRRELPAAATPQRLGAGSAGDGHNVAGPGTEARWMDGRRRHDGVHPGPDGPTEPMRRQPPAGRACRRG
eukprot:scaffold881_cov387-Prasinococcus_capsulatus_cf.AAC.8